MNITSFEVAIHLFGFVLSIVFLVLIIRDRRSLIGSFFKDYYRLMTIAVFVTFFEFLVQPLGMVFGISEAAVDYAHDLTMVILIALLVYGSRMLPKDAAAYMESQKA